jgi:antitoxin (DNA-binding transcriptional repressor) of toxin-antitoxin stability system
MKTVTVRDLRYDFPKVEQLLRAGEEIQITKRKRPIARLTPEPVPEFAGRPPLPDFLAQMRENFGDKVFEVTGAQIISEDREDRI